MTKHIEAGDSFPAFGQSSPNQAVAISNPTTLKFDNFAVKGRHGVMPSFIASVICTFATTSFDAFNGATKPKWHRAVQMVDYGDLLRRVVVST